jgi:predicted ATPase
MWKGRPPQDPGAQVWVLVGYRRTSLAYRFTFVATNDRFSLLDEGLVGPGPSADWDNTVVYYDYDPRKPKALAAPGGARGTGGARQEVELDKKQFLEDESILTQLKDATRFPEITYVGRQFGRIRLYRGWYVGRDSEVRRPQRADLANDFLASNAHNLALVVNNLESTTSTMDVLVPWLQRFYEPVRKITTRVSGGTVELLFHERGLRQPIPATRLSDGTLRYLCLLAVLCHPSPPPLVCIEEPEVGLHPDALPAVAELLVEASQRTQLIVTTHSDRLVSALSGVPEAVVVCERTDEGTELRRLEPDRLKEWLERYSLGELWSMGEIGGNP